VVPLGVTYEKIGTIQRRLAWPLHKDDTLSRSGRPTGLNIYFTSYHSSTSLALPPPVRPQLRRRFRVGQSFSATVWQSFSRLSTMSYNSRTC
ncbi:hypothetical protein OH76DRAFT_1336415, partial [Lentinus brumalis]